MTPIFEDLITILLYFTEIDNTKLKFTTAIDDKPNSIIKTNNNFHNSQAHNQTTKFQANILNSPEKSTHTRTTHFWKNQRVIGTTGHHHPPSTFHKSITTPSSSTRTVTVPTPRLPGGNIYMYIYNKAGCASNRFSVGNILFGV